MSLTKESLIGTHTLQVPGLGGTVEIRPLSRVEKIAIGANAKQAASNKDAHKFALLSVLLSYGISKPAMSEAEAGQFIMQYPDAAAYIALQIYRLSG